MVKKIKLIKQATALCLQMYGALITYIYINISDENNAHLKKKFFILFFFFMPSVFLQTDQELVMTKQRLAKTDMKYTEAITKAETERGFIKKELDRVRDDLANIRYNYTFSFINDTFVFFLFFFTSFIFQFIYKVKTKRRHIVIQELLFCNPAALSRIGKTSSVLEAVFQVFTHIRNIRVS